MKIKFAVFKLGSSTWNKGSRELEASLKEDNFETLEAAEAYVQDCLFDEDYKNYRYIIHKVYSKY